MKLQVILLVFMIGFTPLVVARQGADSELESIQKFISSTEKLTKNKEIRRQLKRTRGQLDRVRELWVAGAIPDSLGLLFEVRRILYRYGSSESQEFQQNMRTDHEAGLAFPVEDRKISKRSASHFRRNSDTDDCAGRRLHNEFFSRCKAW